MKVDITPSELKAIINNYETQMAIINELADENDAIIANPIVDEINSRLNNLKSMYESLIDDTKQLLYVNGIDRLHEDMTMDDALDLLAELKYREGTLFDYER